MRKNIYKWHRTLSLIISFPVLCWALSGFMHPVMTNIRPGIASQFYKAPVIDSSQIMVSLNQVFVNNRIDSFSNARIVQMGGQQFYQVMLKDDDSDIRYFSTKTGNLLTNGDQLYAQFLARQFLEGAETKDSTGEEQPVEPMAMSAHDCCIMATMNIMNSRGAKITDVEKITGFTGEYKYINRLLPVYKVSFGRKDGIRIYVETAGSRFSFAMDNKRAVFDKIFGWFHTWEWMNALGNTKYYIMVLLTAIGFSTTLMGLYIFFTTKTKKSNNTIAKARRRHRYTSLTASLFTLLFTFSGGYHAFDKLIPKNQQPDHLPQRFAVKEVEGDVLKLFSLSGNTNIQQVSLAKLYNKPYWQLYPESAKAAQDTRTDLMKNEPAKPTTAIYIDAATGSILENGEKTYLTYLASSFSGLPSTRIKSMTMITMFDGEYGFINKRLPVWKVSYTEKGNERDYIETSSGVLSVKITDKDLAEGYSFSFLHKHHFMDWAGKTTRDISTMFWAAMQVAMIIAGLVLYFTWKKRKTGV